MTKSRVIEMDDVLVELKIVGKDIELALDGLLTRYRVEENKAGIEAVEFILDSEMVPQRSLLAYYLCLLEYFSNTAEANAALDEIYEIVDSVVTRFMRKLQSAD